MTSLAEYNNNPGNIRPAKGVNYEGMIGIDDKGFAVFEKPEHGQKALINDITYKLEKRGIKTPNDFVDIYSPKGDPENTEDGRDNYKIYMAHVLGLKSTSDPFPENSIEKIAQAITKFESGTWQQEDADKKAGEKPNAATIPEGEKMPPASTEAGLPPEVERGAIGAVVGANVAGAVEAGKKIIPLIPNLWNNFTGQAVNPDKPVTKMALQNWINTMLQNEGKNVRLPISELEKLTGKKIRTMSELGEAYKQIQELKEQKVTKPMVKMVEGRPGVFEPTGRMTASTIPGRPAIDLTPYEVKPTGPIRQAVGNQLMTAGEVTKGALPSILRVAGGALGGALAGVQGYEAFELAKKIQEDKAKGIKHDTTFGFTDDEGRLIAKSMSALGGGMAMFPAGLTQVGGALMQAPELAYQGYQGAKALNKRIKSTTREDADRALTNVDIMGNPY